MPPLFYGGKMTYKKIYVMEYVKKIIPEIVVSDIEKYINENNMQNQHTYFVVSKYRGFTNISTNNEVILSYNSDIELDDCSFEVVNCNSFLNLSLCYSCN